MNERVVVTTGCPSCKELKDKIKELEKALKEKEENERDI
jgi:hypothetical protein